MINTQPVSRFLSWKPAFLFILIGLGLSPSTMAQSHWTWRNPSPFGLSTSSLIWANDVFIAVGGEGNVLTSENGIEWEVRESLLRSFLNSVAWNGSLLVVVGLDGVIMTSPDGVEWMVQSASPADLGFEDLSLYSVKWQIDRFLAVGVSHEGLNRNGVVLTSSDGINWDIALIGLHDYNYNS